MFSLLYKLVLFSFVLWKLCLGYSHQDLVDLRELLYKNYNKAFRPAKNQDYPTTVHMKMGFISIESYNIMTGDFEAFGYVHLTWNDEFLTWNATQFNGVIRVDIEDNTTWTPEIVLLQSKQPNVLKMSRTGTTVSADGTVYLQTYGLFSTKCDTDISRFPFDEHVCSFIFAPNTAGSSELIIKSEKPEFGKFQQNEEWSVDDLTVTNTNFTWSFVEIKLSIRRRPMFLFLHLFIPLTLIAFLNELVCLVPPESGERLSFASALFLAFTFFMASISDGLPKNSINMSVCSICLTAITIVNALCLSWSVVSVRLSSSDTTVPIMLSRIYFTCTGKQQKINNQSENNDDNSCTELDKQDEANTDRLDSNMCNEHGASQSGKIFEGTDDPIENKCVAKDTNENITWKSVTNSLDSCFCVTLIVCQLTIVAIFFIKVFN